MDGRAGVGAISLSWEVSPGELALELDLESLVAGRGDMDVSLQQGHVVPHFDSQASVQDVAGSAGLWKKYAE